ncbi:nuclear transport factor 2 family protein [Rhodococcus sp. (in: high G+C Gram-positive bacteria)]|uniref:nuclear transport factor 2 family protein n=1 Tax=Rhodococcus sp. TaxID=1831 RepID=UPI00257AF9E4|nr:nuclear transport factor 2 family protein [Rhodococcus sp. (in: high G+C Gram-positive bacteria)]
MNDATTDRAARQVIQTQRAGEVLGKYAVACDDADEAALAALFHREATAVYDKDADLSGNAEIAAWVIGATAHLVWQQHSLGVMKVDVEGDRATVVAYLTSHQVSAETPDTVMMMNSRYDAELELVEGSWLIRKLHLLVGTVEHRPIQLGTLITPANSEAQHA